MSEDFRSDETFGSDETVPERRRGFPWLVSLPLILFAALALAFFKQLSSGDDPSRIPSVMIGKKAPEFALAPLDGLKRDGAQVPGIASTDLKAGVTIVNVWASWCIPCREEHPVLLQLAADKRVRLVGLNYKDQAANALRFLSEGGNPYASVGVDPNGRTAIDWGVYGVPETFVVAADGTIAFKFIGPLSDESLKSTLMPEVEKALTRK
ncbi:MAG: DsbE family thiol:disulfide interchange protein [Devosia sp.]|nr:DsbE family thiol:disulfide interchange protein [Devosia sp.]